MHKNPKWHMLEKQADCSAEGIQLIHVMENDDSVVVKKTLSHMLGLDDEKHYARSCDIIVGKSDEKNIQKFFKENHLHGPASGCKSYSLVKNGQVVAAMLFSIPTSERGSKKGSRYELRRFASCCRVVGGASKLLKAFIRDTPGCATIVSYSDNRWFAGNMYKKIGFEEVHETEPDYKYVKNGAVMSKNKFRHSSMKTWKGFDYNPEETEVQNAHRNGWYRIWDCGKKKWELTL
jgi:hypothetical protein